MTIDHIIFKVYDWFPSRLCLTFSDMNMLTSLFVDFRSVATMLKQLDPCNMIIMQIFHCANDTLCCNIPRRHAEELPFWLIRIHERKGLASINEENKHNVRTIVWTATNIMSIVQKYMCSPICTLWACLLSTRRRMLAKLCEIYADLEQTCQQNWCNTTAFRLMKPHLEHTKTGCLTSSFFCMQENWMIRRSLKKTRCLTMIWRKHINCNLLIETHS